MKGKVFQHGTSTPVTTFLREVASEGRMQIQTEGLDGLETPLALLDLGVDEAIHVVAHACGASLRIEGATYVVTRAGGSAAVPAP